jgi:hypothetical protein
VRVDAKGVKGTRGYTAKYDGKDYPYTGDSTYDAVSLTSSNPYVIDAVLKKDGKIVQTTHTEISKDGKVATQTSTAGGKPTKTVQVFDKQ